MEQIINIENNLPDFLAKTVSTVLNPMFIAPAMFGWIINLNIHSLPSPVHLFISIFVFYCLVPFLILATFLYLRKIDSLNIMVQSQRTIPYFLGIVSYIIGYFFILLYAGLTGWVGAAAVTIIISAISSAIINHYSKISVHTTSITIAVIFAALLMPSGSGIVAFVILFLAIPLVAWARVRESAHTPLQTFGGFLLGLFTTLLVLQFYPLS